jgi:NAD(P)-dependent dehydrogenase (short-subunit alcohol dehydrogenase family)
VIALTSDHTVGYLPCGVAKGALDRLVLASAHELSGLGFRANVINPGLVDTGWMDEATRPALSPNNRQTPRNPDRHRQPHPLSPLSAQGPGSETSCLWN